MPRLSNDTAVAPAELRPRHFERPPGIRASRAADSTDSTSLQRWLYRSLKWCVVASLFGIAAGWWLGDRFATDSFTYRGRLTFEPNTVGAPFFKAPAVTDMMGLVEAAETIRALHVSLPLTSSMSATAQAIEVRPGTGAHELVIEYGHTDPETARRVVDTLMRLVSDRSRALRNRSIIKHLETLEKQAGGLAIERAQAQTAYDDLCFQYHSHDLRAEIDANRAAKREANLIWVTQRMRVASRAQRVQRIVDQLAEVRAGSVADETQLLETELLETQLIFKPQELTSVRAGAAASSVARSRWQSPWARDEENDSEDDGHEAVPPRIREQLRIQNQLGERLRLELENLELAEAELTAYQQLIEELDEAHAAWVALGPSLREIEITMQGITDQQKRVNEQRQTMERWLQTDGCVLMAASPASPALIPVSSNKTEIMVAGFGAGTLALLIPVMLFELLRVSPNRYEQLANKHGLPILSRHTSDSRQRGTGGATARILASRIELLDLPQSASLAWVATGRKACPSGLLFGTARHLGSQGDRVLVVEVINAARAAPFPGDHCEEIIQEQTLQISDVERVDRLLIKDPALLGDVM
ncbi:MAG: hypothetical protein ACF788_00985, partial [Novipirellula sp. JB048]